MNLATIKTDNAFFRSNKPADRIDGSRLAGAICPQQGYNFTGLYRCLNVEQRLVIARAIAVKPSVLLLDEPASSLDPISTLKIEELINQLKSEYTIIVVTHNMQQAARVSDQTAFLYLGELIEFNETDQLFTNPRHRQTEDYITGRYG